MRINSIYNALHGFWDKVVVSNGHMFHISFNKAFGNFNNKYTDKYMHLIFFTKNHNREGKYDIFAYDLTGSFDLRRNVITYRSEALGALSLARYVACAVTP